MGLFGAATPVMFGGPRLPQQNYIQIIEWMIVLRCSLSIKQP